MRNTRNIEMSFYKAQKVAAFIMARKVEGDPEYDGSIFEIRDTDNFIYTNYNDEACECYRYLVEDENGNILKDENGKRIYKTTRNSEDVPEYVKVCSVIHDYSLLDIDVETNLTDDEISAVHNKYQGSARNIESIEDLGMPEDHKTKTANIVPIDAGNEYEPLDINTLLNWLRNHRIECEDVTENHIDERVDMLAHGRLTPVLIDTTYESRTKYSAISVKADPVYVSQVADILRNGCTIKV